MSPTSNDISPSPFLLKPWYVAAMDKIQLAAELRVYLEFPDAASNPVEARIAEDLVAAAVERCTKLISNKPGQLPQCEP